MGQGNERNLPCKCGSEKKYKKCCLLAINKTEGIIPNRQPITKGLTTNPSEEYLNRLCGRIFLSLWSYPCVYVEKGRELCDLLVIFGNDVLIFSDKNIKFQTNSEDVNLNWSRWFKKAVAKSAQQLWGAERVIRKQPQLFLDAKCTQPIPIDLPPSEQLKFHLIVVAHGTSKHVKEFFGGNSSGSLIVDSNIKGFDNHTEPFHVGDLCPEKTFVHVLDEDALDTLMENRDTVSDFVSYLKKREGLMRKNPTIIATGEEQLLAVYLKNTDENKEHDFIFPATKEKVDRIGLPEGYWEEFVKSPQRLIQIEADKVSYAWDGIIEKFNYHALQDSQYLKSKDGIKGTEKVLRFMAGEPRFMRRYFSEQIKDMLKKTQKDMRRLRILQPMQPNRPYYVFLLYPIPEDRSISLSQYRKNRMTFLEACCMVTRLKFEEAHDVVGFATETGLDSAWKSEDAGYFDFRNWNEDMVKQAQEAHEILGILKKPNLKRTTVKEYPDIEKV